MPTFQYQAVDDAGKERAAQIDGTSEQEVLTMLEKKNFTVFEIKRVDSETPIESSSSFSSPGAFAALLTPKVPLPVLLTFYDQLAFLIKSGIPIFLAIKMILDNIKDVQLTKLLKQILFDLKEGFTFSSAMQKFPIHFPKLHTYLIGMGERAGNLEGSLQYLLELVQEQQETRAKFIKSMSYPIFLVGMTVTLIFCMVFFVFPRFQEIFDSFEVELPFTTAFLMDLSEILHSYFVVIFGSVFGCIVGVWFFLKSNEY